MIATLHFAVLYRRICAMHSFCTNCTGHVTRHVAVSITQTRAPLSCGLKSIFSSTNGCGRQNSLEAESLRPNSPFGERINDDDDEWRHQFTFDKNTLSFIFIFNSSTIFCQTYYIAIFWLSQGFSSYFLKEVLF